jgi:hypothetical protein
MINSGLCLSAFAKSDPTNGSRAEFEKSRQSTSVFEPASESQAVLV